MNAMASFIQTCFKITSKGKPPIAAAAADKKEKQENNKEEVKKIGKSSEFCKSISDPALNLTIVGAARRKEKSFSVSEDLALKLVNMEDEAVDESKSPANLELEAEEEEAKVFVEDEMSSSFFDNNGNPMDDEDDEAQAGEIEKDPEPPIYFINAATLSEDEEFPSLPPEEEYQSSGRKEMLHFQCEGREQQQRDNSNSSVRPRVPISKSFPDIIQTTMADGQLLKEFGANSACNPGSNRKYSSIIPRDSSGMESLAADSLEELPVMSTEKRNSLSVFNRMSTPSEAEMALTESYAGISGEKPPESWVIDFNSLSLENLAASTMSDKSNKSATDRNNSLSFFVKMDDPLTTDDSLSESSTMTSEKKKIFSMFVDISKDEGRVRTASGGSRSGSTSNSMIPINKPVKSVEYANQSTGDSSRYSIASSKILAPSQKSRSGSTSSSCQQQDGAHGHSHNSAVNLDSVSNRSSLHVPNETENSLITSSLLSSMETNTLLEEMEICQGGPCFKLGMDLLRMFQEGINTDVNISVRGRWVRAHKCILASRSQYFAAILSGNWLEKSGNTISLDDFSYNVVQFTMYHIYSGTNEIPDTIDLIELATLTDLLGLEGLREVISQTIRNKFCHNFHRPCTGCISGILECFPIAMTYGMEDLNRKMTKWICKHFVRVWPTKAFANLGDELVDKCLRYSVNHLSPENLLDITLGCDQLLSTMPTVRWTELIFNVVNQLTEACVQYVGENLSQVLQSQRFILFGKGQSWNISRIESTFFGGILLLKPDEACLSHVALTRLIELGTETLDEVEWSTSFVDFLKGLRREVEKFIMANASRAVLSKNWEYLGQDVRKRICSTSFLGMDKHGNKIQKSGPTAKVPANASTKSALNTKNAAIAASRQPQQQARPLSSGSISNRKPVGASRDVYALDSTSPAASDVQSYGSATTPDARQQNKSVASVRPMPSSQIQRQNVFTDRKVGATATTGNTRGVSGHVHPTQGSATSSPMAARMPAPPVAALRHTTTREREKSFDTTSSSSRNASTSSTLSRAQVTQAPMTPSRSSQRQFPPLTTTGRKSQKQVSQPAPPPQPAKPVFLTNSEKAKAVSRPQMQLRGSRSNSVSAGSALTAMNSSYCRQSSLGSTATTGNLAAQATPRTPNLSQPSRYATSTARRENSERANKPSSSSPLPTPKNRQMRTTVVPTSNVRKTGNIQATTTKSNVGGKSTTISSSRNNRTGGDVDRGNGKTTDFFPAQNSDGLMTKSSIEMETSGSSGEPKMRTLAEIGRSSTFSKDEPTILGKMDISLGPGYNHQF